MKTPKPRSCRCGCKVKFIPTRPLQTVASPDCALKLIERRKAKLEAQVAKIERADIRARKEALKPLQHWLKRAERAFNGWVKARDRELPCVSCGTFDASEFHAGHFISVGAASSLRFDPYNVAKQCAKCNTHLSGNLTNFEAGLVARIGQDEVERLKNAPRARKWTREECLAIETEYKLKLKELTK